MDCIVTVSVFYKDGMVDYEYCGYIPFCPQIGSHLGLGVGVEVTGVSWSFGNDILHLDAQWRMPEECNVSMWDEGVFWIAQEEALSLGFAFENQAEEDVTDRYMQHLVTQMKAYKAGDTRLRLLASFVKNRKDSK